MPLFRSNFEKFNFFTVTLLEIAVLIISNIVTVLAIVTLLVLVIRIYEGCKPAQLNKRVSRLRLVNLLINNTNYIITVALSGSQSVRLV